MLLSFKLLLKCCESTRKLLKVCIAFIFVKFHSFNARKNCWERINKFISTCGPSCNLIIFWKYIYMYYYEFVRCRLMTLSESKTSYCLSSVVIQNFLHKPQFIIKTAEEVLTLFFFVVLKRVVRLNSLCTIPEDSSLICCWFAIK